MSWISNLHDTYCACVDAVGICNEESQANMLLPVGHILVKPDFIVQLREDGTFFNAEQIKEKEFIICAPCTDDSAGRSSKSAINFPHPLFDQMKYLAGDIYRNNLGRWLGYLENKPEYALAYKVLHAIHRYLQNGTLESDMKEEKDLKENSVICFCVNVAGSLENRLWRIPQLWNAWDSYLLDTLLSEYEEDIGDTENAEDICYIAGKKLPLTEKHPKNINRIVGNAKLISGNDDKNFTYRGRFAEPKQAATVSYTASQKAHQALRWLIANQGVCCDTQAIIAWAIDKEPKKVASLSDDSFDIYQSLVAAVPATDTDKLNAARKITNIDYARLLRQTLSSTGNPDKLKKHARRIAILTTDATTRNSGRLSVTYYRELGEVEYHEHIVAWHEHCAWFQPYTQDKNVVQRPGYFIGAPSVSRLVKAVLGKRRKGKDESYDKLEKRMRERLLHCIMDGERIPVDMVRAAQHRASNPLALENKDAKTLWLRWLDWEETICAACSLVKRHYHDKKEEYALTLEEDRREREYLYGRLLAIADRIESHARYVQGNAKDDARATNAIRYMTAFAQHPFRTWFTLWEQLNPYIQQLDGADWYLNEIGKVIKLFQKKEDYESNSPLDGNYLLGFFTQREALRSKEKKSNSVGGEEHESDE